MPTHAELAAAFQAAYLWADGFDDLDWSIRSKYEYGTDLSAQIFGNYDPSARTGPSYLSVHVTSTTTAYAFVGKDLPRAVAAVTKHLAVRPWRMSGPVGSRVQLMSWRGTVASGTDRLGNNGAQGMLWLEKVTSTTARIVLADDLVSAPLAASPADLNITDGLSVEQWQQLCITVAVDATAGAITALLEGVPWWSATGLNTDTTGFGATVSVTVGHAYGTITAEAGYDVDDLLVAASAFGRVRCEFLPPNADGTDADWTIVNGGVNTEPGGTLRAWQALYQNEQFEPDEDLSDLRIAGLVVGLRHSVTGSPLPDPTCGGLVLGVLPVLTLRATDGTLSPTATAYLKLAGTRYAAATDMALRQHDPASQPFAGASGYTTHQETVWATNPASGEVWDPAELVDVEYGVEAFNAPLSWTTAGLLVVRVHPVAVPAAGGIFPEKHLDWRGLPPEVPTVPYVQFHHAPRIVLQALVQEHGAWHDLTAAAEPPYCPAPPAMVTWSDPLTGARVDRRTWDLDADPGGSVAPLGAAGTEIAGPTSTGAFQWAGLFARVAHDPAGLTSTVEVPQVVEDVAGRACHLEWDGAGSFEDYGIRYLGDTAGGLLEFYKWVGTSIVPIASAPYNFALQRWWRLRHDPATDTVYGEWSPDGTPGSWNLLGSEAANPSSYMSAHPVYVCLYAATTLAGVTPSQTYRVRNFSTGPVPHV